LLTTRVAFSSHRPRPQHNTAQQSTAQRSIAMARREFSLHFGPEMTVGDISFRLSFFFLFLRFFKSIFFFFLFIYILLTEYLIANLRLFRLIDRTRNSR
jgi:hypothetical protein